MSIKLDKPQMTVVEVAGLMGVTPKACLAVLERRGVQVDETVRPRRVWVCHLFDRIPELRESLLLMAELRKLSA